MASAVATPHHSGIIGWIPTLRAEVVRTQWSAASFLPLAGVGLAFLSTAFAGAASSAGSVVELLRWQALYATGMAAPFMGLLAGLAVQREVNARSGGTLWRATTEARVAASRVLVLAALSLVFHVLCFGGIALAGVLYGVPGPMTPIVVAGVVSWTSSLGLLAFACAGTQLLGLIPVFLLSLIWQLLGMLTAESPWWWSIPPSWAVRANLPALGIHANAVPLDAGDALAMENPWPALALTLLMTIAATTAMVWNRAGRHSKISMSRVNRPPRRRKLRKSRYGALALGLHGTALAPLTVAAIAACTVTAVTYDHEYVSGLFTYAILPLGSTLLAVLAWSAQREAWWSLTIHSTKMWGVLISWLVGRVILVSTAVATLTLMTGAGADVGRQLLLWILTGTVMALLSLALVVRSGPGMALGISVVWTVLAITLAGDVLATTKLWIFSLPAWAASAVGSGRVTTAVIICTILIAALLPLARMALRRHCAHA